MNKILIPEDKANHCIYGAVMFIVTLALFMQAGVVAPDAAATAAMLIGAVVWEIVRKFKFNYSIDPYDVLWSMAGPGICLAARAL